MSLPELLARGEVWRGRPPAPPARDVLPSGHGALDAALPGGGWPRHGLTEILVSEAGVGALRLVVPALARLSREEGWLAWVAPPYIPYAPALAGVGVDVSRVLLVHPRRRDDGLWVVEQALRAGTCAAVLAWLPAAVPPLALRRLHLAAQAGRCPGFLFRPRQAAADASPAPLRLQVTPGAGRLQVQVLKRRGGGPVAGVAVGLD